MVDHIRYLIKDEMESANKKFPLFSSPHEGYAVMKEEWEEVKQEMNQIQESLNEAWDKIKKNNYEIREIRELKEHAISAIMEMIQVAAMADKFELSHQKNYPGKGCRCDKNNYSGGVTGA